MKKPRLFIVEDNEAQRFLYERNFASYGYQTSYAGSLKEARAVPASEPFDVIILDLKLPDGDSVDWIPELEKARPGVPIIVITGHVDIAIAVKAIKFGAENFLIKPVEKDDLKVVLERCLEIGALRKRDYIQQRLLDHSSPYFGENRATAALMVKADIAATGDMAVLLTGETGTGKGVLARWIHNNGDRRSQAFIQVSCSNLKGELLPSELFGHAGSSITSVIKDKEGLMELADGGTLFLDEIEEMDFTVHGRLLKSIEDKSFQRVGESLVRKSDFRLICATNGGSKADSAEFEKDLCHRILGYSIKLSPLRERKEEIAGLSEYFLADSGYVHFPLHAEVSSLLADYSWPGNTRELKHVLKRAILLSQGAPLTPDHFPGLIGRTIGERGVSSPYSKTKMKIPIPINE